MQWLWHVIWPESVAQALFSSSHSCLGAGSQALHQDTPNCVACCDSVMACFHLQQHLLHPRFLRRNPP